MTEPDATKFMNSFNLRSNESDVWKECMGRRPGAVGGVFPGPAFGVAFMNLTFIFMYSFIRQLDVDAVRDLTRWGRRFECSKDS